MGRAGLLAHVKNDRIVQVKPKVREGYWVTFIGPYSKRMRAEAEVTDAHLRSLVMLFQQKPPIGANQLNPGEAGGLAICLSQVQRQGAKRLCGRYLARAARSRK